MLFKRIDELDLDIINCKGQVYDNSEEKIYKRTI